MGNSPISDASITVLCKCQNEMKSTTPDEVYKHRMPCDICDESIAHRGIMFHCGKRNQYHKKPHDLCETCATKKALQVFCRHCNQIKMDKIPTTSKHKASACNQCTSSIRKAKYIYACSQCNHCIICMSCAKNPSIIYHQQQQYINHNKQQMMTTLHGYAMIGPYSPGKNQVWYCDNKTCQYTKHGLYRKYRIENWRSSRFGKNFVLCDGCIRQYQKVQPVIIAPAQQHVNVEINYNPNPPNQALHRSETEIIDQPEGVVHKQMTHF